MTILEAIDKRIPRVRRAEWNPLAYLRLPLLDDGMHGPWAELYDPAAEHLLGVRPGSQRFICLPDFLPGEWLVYDGEPSEFEKHPDNFAGRYREN